jgi:predicted nucleotidyltransferase
MAALDAEVKRRALAAARILGKMAPVRAAYVFGSRVEGRADRWSDIDVALFLDGLEAWDMRRRAQVMFQIQKGAGLDVEAHLFSALALDRPEEGSFASYIMKHGIPLPLEELAA